MRRELCGAAISSVSAYEIEGKRVEREVYCVTGDLPVGVKVEGADGVVEAVAVSTEAVRMSGRMYPDSLSPSGSLT